MKTTSKRLAVPAPVGTTEGPQAEPEAGVWPRSVAFNDPSFPLVVNNNLGHPPLALHTHEHFSELVVVYGGQGVHFTAEESHPIGEGDVFVVTEDTAHGYRDVRDLWLLNIIFDPRVFLHRTPDINSLPGYHALFRLKPGRGRRQHIESRLRLAPNELARVLSVAEELYRVTRERAPGYQFLSRALFMEVVGFICQSYAKVSRPSARSVLLMDDVIGYLENHYADHITLELLGRVAGMSNRSLLVLFKDATGLSPINYLLRLRISRSCDLLRNSSLSITQLASEVGFDDSNYFARQFRQIMGISPSTYRRKMRHLTLEMGHLLRCE